MCTVRNLSPGSRSHADSGPRSAERARKLSRYVVWSGPWSVPPHAHSSRLAGSVCPLRRRARVWRAPGRLVGGRARRIRRRAQGRRRARRRTRGVVSCRARACLRRRGGRLVHRGASGRRPRADDELRRPDRLAGLRVFAPSVARPPRDLRPRAHRPGPPRALDSLRDPTGRGDPVGAVRGPDVRARARVPPHPGAAACSGPPFPRRRDVPRVRDGRRVRDGPRRRRDRRSPATRGGALLLRRDHPLLPSLRSRMRDVVRAGRGPLRRFRHVLPRGLRCLRTLQGARGIDVRMPLGLRPEASPRGVYLREIGRQRRHGTCSREGTCD